MLYDFDVKKFARMLLPPILRGPVLVALVGISILPIKFIYETFMAYRQSVKGRINRTCNVNSLEKILNDLFFLTDHQIYITTTLEPLQLYMYSRREKIPPLCLHGAGEIHATPCYIKPHNGVSPEPTFVIHIPTFLCTSLDQEQDEYNGRYLIEIYNALNIYKPAGRAYRIELYNYYE